jgi:hypothetical protein
LLLLFPFRHRSHCRPRQLSPDQIPLHVRLVYLFSFHAFQTLSKIHRSEESLLVLQLGPNETIGNNDKNDREKSEIF